MIDWLRRILGIDADYERVQRQVKAINEWLDRVGPSPPLAPLRERLDNIAAELELLRAQLQQLEVRTLPDAIDRLAAYYKAHPGEHEMYVAGEAVGYTNKGVIRADHSRLAKQGAIEAVGGGVYRRGAA